MANYAEPQTLSYVPGSVHAEQQLDLYLPAQQPASSLIVFIHGGAWRTGSRKDHVDLANYLSAKGKAVAVVDYRLSIKDEKTGLSKYIHPVHAQDVNAALAFLHKRQDVPQKDWIVIGHSIGAWLTLAAILSRAPGEANSLYPQPMPVPDSGVRRCIKTCILVDGIFSVSQLLKEYPDYEGFVAQAFLPQPGPSNYDIVSSETWSLDLERKDVHVWHSRDDELLSFKQSIDMLLHLDNQIPDPSPAPSADATTVQIPEDGVASTTTLNGENKSLVSIYGKVNIRNGTQLHADFVSLRGKHDALLHTETFWNLILKL